MARRGVYSLKVLPTKIEGTFGTSGYKRIEMRAYEGNRVLRAVYLSKAPEEVPIFLEQLGRDIKAPRP